MATCRFHLGPGMYHERERSYIAEWACWLAGKSNDCQTGRPSITIIIIIIIIRDIL